MKYLLFTLVLCALSSATSAVPQITSTCSTDADCPPGEVCRVFVLVLGDPILRCLPPLTSTSIENPVSTQDS
ncbi:hypothetical protein F5051DRAFT_407400 [Lentinula edodes]|nr:hypothetical protein F5051DRAFT_407400 [Lentinula edodes]